MDFSDISLSRREIKLLKRSQKRPIDKTNCQRLLRLKMVNEVQKQITLGDKPVGTGMCQISDHGIDYLAYYKSKKNFFTLEYFLTQLLIPLIVGIVSAVITALILNS